MRHPVITISSNLYTRLFIFLALLLIPQSVAAVVAEMVPSHPGGGIGLQKAGRFSKAGTALNKVNEEHRQHIHSQAKTPFRPSNPFLLYSRGKIVVDAVASGDGPELLDDLKGVGLQKSTRFGKVISGWLPIGALERTVGLKSLRFISASYRPITNAGSITSQGDAAMYADTARSFHGVSGEGVTVGVLSDSFDQQDGAATDVLSGDLPEGIDVRDDSANCGTLLPAPCTDEGRAMLQIIHDVAPEASLSFHTAFTGMAGFANGIIDLATGGADIIVDDVMYYAEPMFQDGVVAQAVEQVVAGGTAYFSSAGNQAGDSYESNYVSSGEPLYVQELFFGTRFVGILHDFDPGPQVDWLQNITVSQGSCVVASLQWDQPFGSLAGGNGSLIDLDIYLIDGDESTMTILEKSDSDNVGGGDPVELLQFCNSGTTEDFHLMITYFFEPDPGGGYATWVPDHAAFLKYVHFGPLTVNEYATNSSTVYGHANAAGAEATGAAYYQQTPKFGAEIPILEYFSSIGGTPILFDSNGNRSATPIVRNKPGIVAPDGVDTTFFYPTSDRNNNGIPDFSGTSAAAPHAAAVAALMRQANPVASPADIYDALESTAVDMDEPGFDFASGFGLVKADMALDAILHGNSAPVASFSHTTDGFVVTFTDQSSDSDGHIVAWEWNFGDNDSSTIQNPLHTYPAAGTYTVTLGVTDDGGAFVSTSQEVILSDPDQINSPLNLLGQVNGTTVSLYWEDTSINEEGFYVERAKKTKGKYAFIRIGQTTANTRNYDNVGMEPGTYKYQVQAFTGKTLSDYSNEILIKVQEQVSVCGDGACDPGESSCTCQEDCGSPEASELLCGDGIDNDCDGLFDCDDLDCTSTVECNSCLPKGGLCGEAADCCSGVCRGVKCK